MDLPVTTPMSTLPKISLDHWHIELSSICALKCPRCPRVEVADSLLNRQLSLDFFKNQIGEDTVRQIKKITFCGNDGDPIYCRDFLNIVQWIRDVNPLIQFVLITNGSYKDNQWWQQLGKIFNCQDHIHWSIDGWDQLSNEQYRVNSNWNSIISGIDSFNQINSTTYKTWATIGFKFNESELDQIKELARSLHFDQFQLTKSTKFGVKYPAAYGNTDHLEPTNQNLISSGFRFERVHDVLTNKPCPDLLKKVFLVRAEELQKTSYSGICFIGNKGVFLNSVGEFYPCCWTATRYPHNKDWQGKFNLYQTSFKDVIEDDFWATEFLKFDNLECKTKCTKEKLQDIQHTIEW
jgi:MoaA/NifB/PqqE/SkfB family radical SAM enzyme